MYIAVFSITIALSSFGANADPTCPKQDGKDSVYFPHEDCTKFWQCSNGTPYLFDCPDNLHFNPKLNVCDWPNAAGCKGSGEDSDSSSSSSSSSSESKESGDHSESKDDNSSSNSSSSSGEEGPECPSVDGEDPVYFPHEDCTKFWQCSNGVPYLFNCSANLHFNPKLNVCDWPDQAGCESKEDSSSSSSSSSSSESKESGDNSESKDDNSSSSSSSSSSEEGPECPSVDGEDPVYFPHEDCTKFWQCSNGVPYLFNCSANLHFNPKLNVCDWPDQAGSESKEDSSSSSSSSSSESKESGDKDDSSSSSSSSSSSESKESGDTSESCTSSSEEGPECPSVDGEDPVYFPHEDCTKFWQCSNGVPYLFNCSANLHFNPKLNVCDWPDQAGCESKEDSSSSSSSSSESGDNSQGKDDDKDDSGNSSSSSDSSSSSSSESSEEGPECPSVDGETSVYIPHEDCTKFWQCSNGTPYLFDCPDNLHFNPKLNVCDWPNNAGCKGNK